MSNDNETLWRDTYPVRSYDVDMYGRVRPDALFNFLLNSASSHANAKGFGFHDLSGEGQFWVLSRFLIIIERLPRWEEEITVETWGKEPEKLFGIRDFEVYSGQEKLAVATSAWLVLDRKTLRPQKLDKLKDNFPIRHGCHAIEKNLEKLPALSNEEFQGQYKVRFSDLDVNQHVTSAKYLQWVMDSFPAETRTVKSWEINFLAEALLGDEVIVGVESGERESSLCRITRDGDGKEFCRVRVRWNNDIKKHYLKL